MLCDHCELTSICKLYGFASGEGLLRAIVISECQFYSDSREPAPPQGGTDTHLKGTIDTPPELDTGSEPKSRPAKSKPQPASKVDPKSKARPPVQKDYTNLVLANSDLEGIIGAMAIVYENGLDNYRIYFTQPGRLEESTSQLHAGLLRVFICGVGVNVRAPAVTSHFISALQDFDFTWFDNHPGWTGFLEQQFPELPASDFGELGFQFDEGAASCVELISNEVLLNALVGRQDEGSEASADLGQLFQAALKAAPSDHSTRYDIVNYLLLYLAKGETEAAGSREYQRLKGKAEKYHRLQPMQRSLVEDGQRIGEVLVMRQPTGVWVNYQEIFEQALGRAPHAILLAERDGNLRCRECGATFRKPSRYGDCPRCHADSFTSGTSYNTLVVTATRRDLRKLFNIRNGQPHRLTLYGDRVEEALKVLNENENQAMADESPVKEPMERPDPLEGPDLTEVRTPAQQVERSQDGNAIPEGDEVAIPNGDDASNDDEAPVKDEASDDVAGPEGDDASNEDEAPVKDEASDDVAGPDEK